VLVNHPLDFLWLGVAAGALPLLGGAGAPLVLAVGGALLVLLVASVLRLVRPRLRREHPDLTSLLTARPRASFEAFLGVSGGLVLLGGLLPLAYAALPRDFQLLGFLMLVGGCVLGLPLLLAWACFVLASLLEGEDFDGALGAAGRLLGTQIGGNLGLLALSVAGTGLLWGSTGGILRGLGAWGGLVLGALGAWLLGLLATAWTLRWCQLRAEEGPSLPGH